MATASASISTTVKCPIKVIHNHIQSLPKEEDDQYLQQSEESLPPDNDISFINMNTGEVLHMLPPISIVRNELQGFLHLLKETCRGQQLSSDPHFHPATCCCPFQEPPSMNENTSKGMIDTVEPVDEQRYLCISNGLTICCLDLKQGKVPSKISTLELGMQDLPLSLGLLKLGSQAYMVGGQEFSPLFSKDALSDLKGFRSDLEVFRHLNENYALKGGSSSKTYHLSMDNGSLRLSQCSNIRPQTNPKSWPIVNKIDGQIHVIETLPSLGRAEIPSHGVLDLTNLSRGWYELSPLHFPKKADSCGMYISNHFAVGHRIYGGCYDLRSEFVVFDTKRHKWELHKYPCEYSDFFTIKHVAEILRFQFGFGMCIGEYAHGASGDPLYVVLGIGGPDSGLLAVAYLVTNRGQVLCFQRLTLFFDSFEKPLGRLQAVINGGEEGKKTSCVICQGYGTDTLYIITFHWEEVDDAPALVSDLPAQSSDEDNFDNLAYIDEEDFVNVVVKGCYVAHFGTGLPTGFKVPSRLSACFLNPTKYLAGPVMETVTANKSHDTSLTLLEKRTENLHKNYKILKRRAHTKTLKMKKKEKVGFLRSMLSYHIRSIELEKLSKALKLIYDDPLSLKPDSDNANTSTDGKEKAVATHACSFQERSSLSEVVDDARYLCVYDGFTIHCLDLKRGKKSNCYESLPPLPTISTCRLVEEGLPASMGLFKIGSDAYLMSGQEFPGIENHPKWESELEKLYERYDYKGSSRKTHHLSLCDGKLAVFECDNIPQLRKAKFWPIVEKIGSRIHVIESIPDGLFPPETAPSHEVLNLDGPDCQWVKLPSMRHPENKGFAMYINDVLVVGDRIYAKPEAYGGYLVLDYPTEKEWKWCQDDSKLSSMPVAYGICVEPSPNRYVVIDAWSDVKRRDEYCCEMVARAYRVTPTGQLVSYQDVSDEVFGGLKRAYPTKRMLHRRLFRVGEQGGTVCGIFLGWSTQLQMEFLYISTFTVECDGEDAGGEEFVKVAVKDTHLYRVDASELRIGREEDILPPRWSACFLKNPAMVQSDGEDGVGEESVDHPQARHPVCDDQTPDKVEMRESLLQLLAGMVTDEQMRSLPEEQRILVDEIRQKLSNTT